MKGARAGEEHLQVDCYGAGCETGEIVQEDSEYLLLETQPGVAQGVPGIKSVSRYW